MHRVVILGIVTSAFLLASGPPSGADPPPDFLSIARGAIGDPQALAKVHGLHATLSRQIVAAGSGDDRHGGPVDKEHIWLEPPSRFLDRIITGGGRPYFIQSGIDDARVIAPGRLPEITAARLQRGKLRRFALAWLLFDPDALGVSLADEGTATVHRHVVRVLHATDDVGFDLRLYFDPASHRLLMTDDYTMTAHGIASNVNGRATSSTSSPETTAERITYGEYRSVDGIELPFSIAREVSGTPVDLWHVIKYELNPTDLDAVFKP